MNRQWQGRTQVDQPRNFGGLAMLFGGAALGAGLMFLLDPRGGGRRRALIRDKFVRGSRMAQMYGGKVARQVGNEVRGKFEEQKAHMRDEDVSDDVLVERVRAQIGHVVSHPGSIEVIAEDGIVTLTGPVLRGEIDKVRERLDQTRGVRDYRIELREYEEAAREPGLQGESRDQRERRFGT